MSCYDREGFVTGDTPTAEGQGVPPSRAVLAAAIIDQTEAVRLLQRAYYQGKSRAVLDRCKSAEVKLDGMIAAYRLGKPIATQEPLL